MNKKLLLVAALAVVGAAGVTFYSASRSDVYAAEESAAEGSFEAFTTRVAEILGIEEDQLSSAMEQAKEEGYGPMKRGGKAGMGALTTCTDISAEELRAVMMESEGLTHSEVLQSLGVDDLEAVSDCLLEEKLSHIDELEESEKITSDRADQMREKVSEFSEDFLNQEIGEHKMMHSGEGGFGRGMREGLGQEL